MSWTPNFSIALGAKTYKMKFGHRGCNHPVKNHIKNTVEITSQNHGFCINENIKNNFQITHTSLNDNTVEGIKATNYPAFMYNIILNLVLAHMIQDTYLINL